MNHKEIMKQKRSSEKKHSSDFIDRAINHFKTTCGYCAIHRKYGSPDCNKCPLDLPRLCTSLPKEEFEKYGKITSAYWQLRDHLEKAKVCENQIHAAIVADIADTEEETVTLSVVGLRNHPGVVEFTVFSLADGEYYTRWKYTSKSGVNHSRIMHQKYCTEKVAINDTFQKILEIEKEKP